MGSGGAEHYKVHLFLLGQLPDLFGSLPLLYPVMNRQSGQLSPHLFVIGYEATQRMLGGSWLNVITVENISVSGINQSVFMPSANGIVGFEIAEQFQIGTGVHLTPFDPNGHYVHQIVAAGWTPKAGTFNVPFHVMLIPDVNGRFRVGTTVGVNW